MLKSTLIAIAVLATFPAIAQDAAAPAPAIDPATLGVAPPAKDNMPGVTGRGEAVTNEEFVHRQRLRKLARTLEIEEAEVKIAEAQSRRRKAEGGEEGTSQMPLPIINPRAAYIPAPAGPQANAGALQPDSAAPPPAPAPVITAAPEVIGLIGDRALFKLEDTAVSASPGDDVGDYTVVAINGRQVTLESRSTKGAKKVLTAP